MSSRSARRLLSVALLAGVFAGLARPSAAQISTGVNAIDALGELDSATDLPVYTKSGSNDTPNSVGLYAPSDVLVDAANHRLFVADAYNYRVVVYTLNARNDINSRTMTNVIGQADFNSDLADSVGTSTGMYEPKGLAYDSAGQRLFVADTYDNRVLVYNVASITNGMAASNVLGQTGFLAAGSALTQTGMNGPDGLAYDSAHQHLFVADSNNNRVLVFFVSTISNGMTASIVLGQPGYTTSAASPIDANTMNNPNALAYDQNNGRLFVADSGNNRVLVFTNTNSVLGDGENATDVVGQSTFTAGTADTSGARTTMYEPQGLAYDGTSDRLFVADTNNDRVLTFTATIGMSTGSFAATFVIGQPGFGSVGGGLSATQLSSPYGLWFDGFSGNLFIADSQNYRVLVSSGNNLIGNGLPAYDEVGVADASGNALFAVAGSGANDLGFDTPVGVAVDTVNHRLFVADNSNNRVVVYSLNSSNSVASRIMTNVLGQPDFNSSGSPAVANSTGMNHPSAVVYDPSGSRLFVADESDNRVLVFTGMASITNGMAATGVLGQTDLNSSVPGNSPTATAGGMFSPSGLAYDAAGSRLFVSDTGNHRVLIFNPAASFGAGGANASAVLGQTSMSGNSPALTQTGMNKPAGLAYDPNGGRLFVADGLNIRVLVFGSSFASGAPADSEIGQIDFTHKTLATTQSGMGYTNGDVTYGPTGLAYDGVGGRLFVSDYGNSRVLVYYAAQVTLGMPASIVLGQPNFTSNPMWTTKSGMCSPQGIAFDGTKNLFVADQDNERVLVFNAATTANNPAFGAIATGAIAVNWTASGADGYVLNASTAADLSGTLFSAATTNGAATGLTVNGLAPNTTYFVAFGALHSPTTNYAATMSTSTLAVEPGGVFFPPLLQLATSFQIDWSTSGNPVGATIYNVLISTAPNPVAPGGALETSSNTYNAFLSTSGLSTNVTYYIEVRAINNNSIPTVGTISTFWSTTSSPSGPSSPTAPSPPSAPILSAIDLSSNTILWSWTASSGAASYQLLSTTGGVIANLGAATTSYLSSDLSVGTTYSYFVEALNANGSSVSNTVTVGTPVNFTYCSGQGSLFDPLAGAVTLQFPPNVSPLPLEFLLSDNPILQPMTDATNAMIASANSGLPATLQGSTTSVREFLAVLGSARYKGTFAENVIVSVPYPDAHNAGTVDGSSPTVAASTLQLYTINEASGTWVLVPGSTVDTKRKLVSGAINHLSIFGAFGVTGSGVGAIGTAVLGSPRLYPNPYRPASGNPDLGGGSTGITFDNLQPGTVIKIYTPTGQLVIDLGSIDNAEKYVWDARNGSGRDVASGLYLAVITSPGSTTLVKKFLVIR
ncbi:MAG: hypothetical protein ACHQ49_10920 [Elusimicrobiota bacterium]